MANSKAVATDAQVEPIDVEPVGQTQNTGAGRPAAVESTVAWDDSQMVTHFANVVNIQSTLEQFDLFFGTNKTWNAQNDQSLRIELTSRVILGPHAAKRLWTTLGGVIQEYEMRYGEIKIPG